MTTTRTTETPCGKCLMCASFSSARLPRKAPSIGGRGCLQAAEEFLAAVPVCSVCGAGARKGQHTKDLPTDKPCSGFTVITAGEFRKARA